MLTVPDMEIQARKDDGCLCPQCHDRIPEQFYCRSCGYVPNWRQMAQDDHEACRKAA